MRIIFHTQYYPPEVGAPQARLHALAVGLSRKGFQVTVLTAMPSYPRGHIYDGYGGLVKVETLDGIRIVRTAIYPSQSAKALPRLLSYFSFVLSSLLIGGFYVGKADFLFTESPPLFLGVAGYLLSLMKGARWVFNVSDLWPESAIRLGIVHDGFALRISCWLESFFYRHAWRVSGQSREILYNISTRFPATPVYHLSNGADTLVFKPGVSSEALRDTVGSGIVALYAGLHGLAQGLDQVLSAVAQLRAEARPELVLIGDGPTKTDLVRQAEQLGLDHVHFLAPLSHEAIPGILACADFCIVPLGILLPGAVPSKLYEAMAAGRAILLMAHGEAAAIVQAADCGLIVEPGDISGLAVGMQRLTSDAALRDRYGRNARLAAETRYDRKAIIDSFADFLMTAATI